MKCSAVVVVGWQQWIHTESPRIHLNSTTVWTHVLRLNPHTQVKIIKSPRKNSLSTQCHSNPCYCTSIPWTNKRQRVSKTTTVFQSGSRQVHKTTPRELCHYKCTCLNLALFGDLHSRRGATTTLTLWSFGLPSSPFKSGPHLSTATTTKKKRNHTDVFSP